VDLDVCVRDVFEKFLSSIEGQSWSSQYNYTRRLDLFLNNVGDKLPRELTSADVNDWYNEILLFGYADATNSGYVQAMKTFCSWLYRRGYVDQSPAEHMKFGSFVSKKNKLPNESSVLAVTNLALHYVRSESSSKVELLRALGWLMSWESGGRLGELVNVRFSDVRDALEAGPNENMTYSIVSSGKTKEAVLEFSKLTAAALECWFLVRPATKHNRLFVATRRTRRGGSKLDYYPLTKRGFQSMLEALCGDANVRPILPHSLRHRAGDLITREYGPKVAQMKLNHKDVKTVLDFYHHPDRYDVNCATVALAPAKVVKSDED